MLHCETFSCKKFSIQLDELKNFIFFAGRPGEGDLDRGPSPGHRD